MQSGLCDQIPEFSIYWIILLFDACNHITVTLNCVIVTVVIIHLKRSAPKNVNPVIIYLLTIKSFQTCMNVFVLNTREDILKNEENGAVLGQH